MKKSETSDSWNKFIKELQVKCQEQEVSLVDLVTWIRDSINQIERATFDYYVTSGPMKDFPTTKVDIAILFGNLLHGFTIMTDKKEHVVLAAKSFFQYKEEIIGDRFTFSFIYSALNSWGMEDSIQNLAKVREFSHKILNRMWEKQ